MTTSATNPSTPAPLRFYQAVAIKRICLNSGFVEPNAPMFLAKWQELYVIAKDDTNFFIVPEAQASEYVRTERDEKNKLKLATNAPTIVPTGPGFEWTVECGSTCPDGCDETVMDRRVVANKEEALAQAAQWDGTRVRGNREFIRIRGPAFYQIKRPTPRPAPVVVPTPPRPARNAPVPTSRNFDPYNPYARDILSISMGSRAEWQGILNQYIENNYIDMEIPTIRRSAQVVRNASGRISEELLRSVRAFQQATVTPAPVSIPETPSTDSPRRTGSN